MRIGVICEGQTDFIALKHFLGGPLEKRDITVSFIPIQPNPDNTSDGGWTRVFYWLLENPPQTRIINFFGGGLFAGNLSAKQCDVLVIQMDSDILEEPSFLTFMASQKQSVNLATTTVKRGIETERLLVTFSDHSSLTTADQNKHIFAPTIESSETWCIAAFNGLTSDPETLAGKTCGMHLVLSWRNQMATRRNLPTGGPVRIRNGGSISVKQHKDSNFIEAQSTHFKQLVDRMEEFHTINFSG